MFNIWSSIQNGVLLVFRAMLSYFPTADPIVLTTMNDKLASFKSLLAGLDWVMPIDSLFTILYLMVSIEASIFTYKIVRYLVSQFTFGFIQK